MKPKPYKIGFPRAKARPGSQRRGQATMNKTEARFADLLQGRLLAGEILWWEFEPMKLRIGEDWKTTYTPDFLVVLLNGEMELIDVKGSGPWEEDARVKVKTAARMYPMFHWVGEQYKGAGVGFVRETISKLSGEEKGNAT